MINVINPISVESKNKAAYFYVWNKTKKEKYGMNIKSNTVIPLWKCVVLGSILGVAAFLAIYGAAPLNPTNDIWLLGGYDEKDITQHYAGWLAFRNSPWAFPLGFASYASVPDGTIISYTDSIPWVAILCKVFRNILPDTWQYFGLYMLLCFMLQGTAAAMLIKQYSHNEIFITAGCILFIFAPIFLDRAFRHTALSSHWLILFSMYLYLEYRRNLKAENDRWDQFRKKREKSVRMPWQYMMLNVMAIGIHPYFLPITMIFTILCCIEYGIYMKKNTVNRWLRSGAYLLINIVLTLLAGWCLGVIGWSPGDSREGFGFYSMNLNSLVNPVSPFGYRWSTILPILPQGEGQYEGFNYLGVGVLLLLLFAAVIIIGENIRESYRIRNKLVVWARKNMFLLLAILMLTLFSLSNTVSFGTHSFTIPLPKFVLYFCGIFRSSGRMFYTVWYIMVLAGLKTISCIDEKCMATLIAIFLVCIQFVDLSSVIVQKNIYMTQSASGEYVPEIFLSQELQDIGKDHSKLLLTNNISSRRDLAVLAGQQGMTCNAVLATGGGNYEGAWNSMMEAAPAEANSGKPDPDAVYVTDVEDIYTMWCEIYKDDTSVSLIHCEKYWFLIPLAEIY